MRQRIKSRSLENSILTALMILLLAVFIGGCFDYYFELNDDVFMKDILAGVYTGQASGFNIQMLFPLSWLISMFYVVIPGANWYGFFLCACQFICLYLIGKRLISYAKNRIIKIQLLFLEVLIILSMFLYELVIVQYTVTSALLGGTALFLMYTSKQEVGTLGFLKENWISIILVVLSVCLRKNMLFLIFPLIGLAGLYKWTLEQKFFQKKMFAKYLTLFGVLLIGIAASLIADKIAYGSTEWQEFRSFFNHRTTVYDYYSIPPYEGNESFYSGIGLTESERYLLENYNFAIDDEIDAKLMEKIADYWEANKALLGTPVKRLSTAFYDYYYRTTHTTDAPWNYFVLGAYGLLVGFAILRKNRSYLWKLPLLVAGRTCLWMYILYVNRPMNRVLHSLYLVEFLFLAAMILEEWRAVKVQEELQAGNAENNAIADNPDTEDIVTEEPVIEDNEVDDVIAEDTVAEEYYASGDIAKFIYKPEAKNSTVMAYFCAGILSVLALYVMSSSFTGVMSEGVKREAANAAGQSLDAYCEENAENFYFVDVYSTVGFSEKMFEKVDNSLKNYDIMGGWLVNSPLHTKKLALFQIEDVETALLDQKNVYFISQAGSDVTWLETYYQDKGYEVDVRMTDAITTGALDTFYVYQIIEL